MKYCLIKGGIANDSRGSINFFNDFDMSMIKRFYVIRNANNSVIRGWRGHKIEQRWFYVISGCFDVYLVNIDNWVAPNRYLDVEVISLNYFDNVMLHVPAGYATAFIEKDANSELLVLADYGIENAKNDNYTYSHDYFRKASFIKE